MVETGDSFMTDITNRENRLSGWFSKCSFRELPLLQTITTKRKPSNGNSQLGKRLATAERALE